MISGDEFIQLVEKFFHFLIEDFDFKESNVTNRKSLFYDVEYKKQDIVISISYENRENYLQVILFNTKNGILPDYDDKSSTIHLNILTKKLFALLNQNDQHRQ